MRDLASKAGLALAAIAVGTASRLPAEPPPIAQDQPVWLVCYLSDGGSNRTWVSAVRRAPAAKARDGHSIDWFDVVSARYKPSGKLTGGCRAETSQRNAEWRRALLTDPDPLRRTTIIDVADWSPTFAHRVRTPTPILDAAPVKAVAPDQMHGQPYLLRGAASATTAPPAPAQNPAPAEAKLPAVQLAAESPDAEADFQRRFAEYQRLLAERQRQAESFKRAQAELARTKAEQRDAADRAAADYARQVQAHQEILRNHRAQLARYVAQTAPNRPGARHAATVAAPCAPGSASEKAGCPTIK